ncbi:unnamed protein product [Mycena citricolor]|uniref:Glycoside hydrolase family 71 protein n=1 Tax=Mycena citricolor TaxID=2018698 RepID=A0AAD2K826_9AGAR|nr:unnamed protein product [Mycena citricolor]
MRVFTLAAAMLLAPLKVVDAAAVFAHFMITNTGSWGVNDWVNDMKAAQAMQLDAFVINMAVGDPHNSQLSNAFAAAQSTGFNLFFSFDYGGNGPWTQQQVLDTLTPWIGNARYYKRGSSPMVSTFAGDANHADWTHIKSVTGCYFIPDWSAVSAKEAWSYGQADGLFSWAAWPVGPQPMNTFPDASYLLFEGDDIANRPVGANYMMPVSPWFYTNLPGYGKNWLWNGDTLWFDRWDQVFYSRPDFVEIISWNDFGESHYIGPLNPTSYDAFTIGKAPFNYVDGMPHTGWTTFLPYLIQTYKTGKAAASQQLLTAWFRLSPAAACGDGGTTGDVAAQLQVEYPPSQMLQDKIYFAALLNSEVAPTVTVGGNSIPAQWDKRPYGGVGIYRGSAAYGGNLGTVQVNVAGMVVTGQSITTVCHNGLNNFNAWVGSATGSGTVAPPVWSIYDTSATCIAGTSVGNFQGLCNFSCKYGYCPYGSCICTQMGIQPAKPPPTTTVGYPAAGMDASYGGLCSFDCTYGYCPTTACDTVKHPLTTPSFSPFNPNVCTKGSAKSDPNLGGLCSFACGFGMCPMHVCNCDLQGPQPVLPAYTASATGVALSGVTDGGLCSWSCPYGYCPPGACAHGSSPPSGPTTTSAPPPPPTTTQAPPPPTTTTFSGPTSCPSIYSVAKKHLDQMMTYYVAPPNDLGGGVWISEPDDADREWTDANKWETLYNYVWATGDKTYDIFNQIAGPYPGGGQTAPPAGWDTYFGKSRDDALWTALMFIKVGQYKASIGSTSDPHPSDFYVSAYSLHTLSGQPGHRHSVPGSNRVSALLGPVFAVAEFAGTGNDCTYKNTITNGLFLLTSATMYNTVGGDQYLNDAKRVWAWLETSGARRSDGIWYDGIQVNTKTGQCSVDQGLWTYNQGVIAAGLAGLYVATGRTNHTLLDIAEQTIDAVFSGTDFVAPNGIIRESCDISASQYKACSSSNPDPQVFKGIFMKHLQYYIDTANDSTNRVYHKYFNKVFAQYSGVYHYATDSVAEAGNLWWTPSQGGMVINGYTDQAALDCILAAAKYGGCQSTG